MTELLLVRHREVTHNLLGRLVGWAATSLAKAGQRQVRAHARTLDS